METKFMNPERHRVKDMTIMSCISLNLTSEAEDALSKLWMRMRHQRKLRQRQIKIF